MASAQSRWIWRSGERLEHEFVWFRREFTVAEKCAAILRVSAPDQFAAYLDGVEVLRGQFSDYPDVKTYTDAQLQLAAGRHEIAILAYFCGRDFGDCAPGVPAMRAEIKMAGGDIGSDAQWQCRPAAEYRRDRLDCNQYGFAISYDAGNEDLPRQWRDAVEVAAYAPQFIPRPVPSLEMAPPVAGQLIRQGCFQREMRDGSVADCIAADLCYEMPPFRCLSAVHERRYAAAMPPPPWTLAEKRDGYDGIYLVFDLGGEFAGLETFDWEFPPGTRIDIAYGEHLADNRVRCKIGPRNFADSYIAAAGRRQWTLMRRVGCRYLELHIIPAGAGPCVVYFAGLIPWQLPLPEAAEYESSDLEMMALRRNSVRTLELCMHEHYEDCPWREQALYAYDSRNQMVYGACLWGNFDFAAASLKLLGRGLRADGLLNLCAPTINWEGPPIPAFTLIYLVELAEYYRWSGRDDVLRVVRDSVDKITAGILSGYDGEAGLYKPLQDKGIWNFYEWRDGADGCTGPDGFEALYNLYCIEAMDGLAWMLDDAEWAARADCLRKAVHAYFYDRAIGCYRSRRGDERLHEITQVLALYNRCVPRDLQPQLRRQILSGRFIPVSLSSMRYCLEVMLPEAPDQLEQRLREVFLPMTRGNSTTMWETELGEADFDHAGSLCHGWSALPVYYQTVGKLGVRPVAPGFRSFSISPLRLTEKRLEGTVPTPFGPIRIRLGKTEDGDVVEAWGPSECRPVWRARPDAPFAACFWNGVKLA